MKSRSIVFITALPALLALISGLQPVVESALASSAPTISNAGCCAAVDNAGNVWIVERTISSPAVHMPATNDSTNRFDGLLVTKLSPLGVSQAVFHTD